MVDLSKLPRIDPSQTKAIESFVSKNMNVGELEEWLNNALEDLKENNPHLYTFVTGRSRLFSMGALGIVRSSPNDESAVQSMMLSLALEEVVLLSVLAKAIESEKGLNDFKSMMNDLLGGDEIEGLNG